MSDYNKYKIESPNFLAIIKDLESFVFEHESEFLAKFCGLDAIDLTKFSINSENIEFTFVINSGQHICNSIKRRDLMIWISQIEEKDQREKLKDFNLETEDLVKFLFKVQTGELTCRLAAQILDEKIAKLENKK